jgi:hypothetical protein
LLSQLSAGDLVCGQGVPASQRTLVSGGRVKVRGVQLNVRRMNGIRARRPIYICSAVAHTHVMPGTSTSVAELDPRTHEALTDLHAYVLVLDAEWQRSKRSDLREELDALRSALAALRERLL